MTFLSVAPPQVPVWGYTEGQKILESKVAYETGSFFGTPIRGVLDLQQIRSELGQKEVTALKLENCVLEVSLPRNIVKTAIVNRPGTVKEFISDGDFQIMARGSLFVKSGEEDKLWNQVKHLTEFAQAKVMVPIYHELLFRLEVYDVVIEDLKFPVSKYQNTQPYQLKMSSDRVFTYNLKG